MRMWFAGALMALCVAVPSSASAVQEVWQAEGSGIIDIAADGTVEGFVQDKSLGREIDALILQQVEAWRFNPVIENGQAIRVRAKVELQLQAVPQGESMRVSVADAKFYEIAGTRPDGSLQLRERGGTNHLTPPRYPRKAGNAGAMGRVVFILDIDREGKVVDAIVERLDLLATGARRSAEIKKYAEDLEKSARAVMPEWSFRPDGLDYGENGIARVRVPVDYWLPGVVWGRLYTVVSPPSGEEQRHMAEAISDLGASGRSTSPRLVLQTQLTALEGG
jgi:hypothetical protein